MSEEIAFRIQLGIILPKLKEKIAADMSDIVEELVTIVKAGTLEGESDSFDMAPVKGIIMQDLEIFLDQAIFPAMEAKFNPPQEASEAGGEEAAAEGGEGEDEA